MSSVVRNIIKLAYFIFLASQMDYNLINIQWFPIVYLSHVYRHVHLLFISTMTNHRLWPPEASSYCNVVGWRCRALALVYTRLKVEPNMFGPIQLENCRNMLTLFILCHTNKYMWIKNVFLRVRYNLISLLSVFQIIHGLFWNDVSTMIRILIVTK